MYLDCISSSFVRSCLTKIAVEIQSENYCFVEFFNNVSSSVLIGNCVIFPLLLFI